MSNDDPFSSLRDVPIEMIRSFANAEHPRPEEGKWWLISPTGRLFSGETPLKCAGAELSSRVPARQQLARIYLDLVGQRHSDSGGVT